MINLFKFVPAAIKVFHEVGIFNKILPEVERLHAEGRYDEERTLINLHENILIDKLSNELKVTYTIKGKENIPAEGPILIVANHQSYGDVLAILKTFDNLQVGFIAKSEFKKIKVLKTGGAATRTIFIDRGNARETIKTLREAADLFDKGFSLTIFPEGTRSQGPEQGEFKAGAFKFAEKGKVPILPVSISYAYKLFEDNGTVKPCHMEITVHPLVHYEKMSKAEQRQANHEIEKIIKENAH